MLEPHMGIAPGSAASHLVVRPCRVAADRLAEAPALLMRAPITFARLVPSAARCESYRRMCEAGLDGGSASQDYWAGLRRQLCQLALPACSSWALSALNALFALNTAAAAAALLLALAPGGLSLLPLPAATALLQWHAAAGAAAQLATAALALMRWGAWCGLCRFVAGGLLPEGVASAFDPERCGVAGLAALFGAAAVLQVLGANANNLLSLALSDEDADKDDCQPLLEEWPAQADKARSQAEEGPVRAGAEAGAGGAGLGEEPRAGGDTEEDYDREDSEQQREEDINWEAAGAAAAATAAAPAAGAAAASGGSDSSGAGVWHKQGGAEPRDAAVGTSSDQNSVPGVEGEGEDATPAADAAGVTGRDASDEGQLDVTAAGAGSPVALPAHDGGGAGAARKQQGPAGACRRLARVEVLAFDDTGRPSEDGGHAAP